MQKISLNNYRGFTLLEILIAIVISGVLLVGVTKYYRTAADSYSLQEQISEMNQNAQYVLKELSEILIQAGAACVATSNATTDGYDNKINREWAGSRRIYHQIQSPRRFPVYNKCRHIQYHRRMFASGR